MSKPKEKRHWLEVYTYPVKGAIYINDKYVGTGRVKLLLPEGVYKISFGEVYGYIKPPTRSVHLVRKTTERGRYKPAVPRPPRPKPPAHWLEVDTYPVKGDVYVNGEYWGRAPVKRLVPEGRYIITFGDVPGYYTPVERYVTVTRRTKVEAPYMPIPRPVPKPRWWRVIFALGTYDPSKRALEVHFRAPWSDNYDERALEKAEYYMKAFMEAADYNVKVFEEGWETNYGYSDDEEFAGKVFTEEECPRFLHFLVNDYDYGTVRAESRFEIETPDWMSYPESELIDRIRRNLKIYGRRTGIPGGEPPTRPLRS